MTDWFTVEVESVVDEAVGVRRFQLAGLGEAPLPEATPGSHIDVEVPRGPVRQYSLCDTGVGNTYTIAVKLEDPSRGGSAAMHRLRERDVLKISSPRNTFALSENAGHHVFIAGGIGITPILSMVRHLATLRAAFELHYFARSVEHMVFHSMLTAPGLGERTFLHDGLDPVQTEAALINLIGDHADLDGAHLYCCGPSPLMNVARSTALARGWPATSLHEERFVAAESQLDDSEFDVLLARSGREVAVGAGETVLDALTRCGIEVDSSCEQGICGTCVTRVLDGPIDHRDQFLTDEERFAGDQMCLCVSRCRGSRLVLDL